MKKLAALVMSVVLSVGGLVHAQAGNLTLEWLPVTTNETGTILDAGDVLGYNLYSGRISGNYGTPVNVGNVTNATIPVAAGYWFLAVSCINVANSEGAKSDELAWRTPSLPSAPTLTAVMKPSQIILSWPQVTTCVDGQPMYPADRAGYKLLRGSSPSNLTVNGFTTNTTYNVTGLTTSTWFAVVTVGTNLVSGESASTAMVGWAPSKPGKGNKPGVKAFVP